MYNIFVIMPFDKEFEDLYLHMKENIEKETENCNIFRADDLLNQQNILKDIVESINSANLIIADLTSLNPNVFYELGLAHAFKKDVILLTQDVNELPFDLRSYRVIPYSLHFKEIEEFISKIVFIIKESICGTCSYSNPVTDFINFSNIDDENSIITTLDMDTSDNGKELDDNDNYGILDSIADIEESLRDITETILFYTEKTKELTDVTNEVINNINKANSNPSGGTATYIRKQARKLSTNIDNYVESLESINIEYESKWYKFDKGLANLISKRESIIENSKEEFIEFIKALEFVKDEIIDNLESIDGMIDSANNIKGMERYLTRSVKSMEEKLKKFNSLLRMSEASLDRAIIFGKIFNK